MAIIQLPKEVDEALNVVAIKCALDLGKSVLQSELNKKTKDLTRRRKDIKKEINMKIMEHLASGLSVKDELTRLYSELNTVEAEIDTIAEPLRRKINPISRVVSKLDKKVIPIKVEKALGKKIVPKFTVDEDILLLLQTVTK